MTIIEAFGTFTPTSITVVATIISAFSFGKIIHGCIFFHRVSFSREAWWYYNLEAEKFLKYVQNLPSNFYNPAFQILQLMDIQNTLVCLWQFLL